MKKIFPLLVLIIITIGVFPCKAQTASAGLSLDIFCQPLSKSGQSASSLGISKALWGKLQCVKSDGAINSSLLNAGFKCNSKKQARIFDDSIGEYISYMKAQYSKTTSSGTIYVNMEFDGIHITFPSAAEKNKFITNIKAKGYRSNGYGTFQIPGNESAYWVGVRIEVEGNVVYIVGGQG